MPDFAPGWRRESGHRPERCRCWRSRTCPRPSAGCAQWTASTSRWRRASCAPSSAPTAPARAPSSNCCSAASRRTRARSGSGTGMSPGQSRTSAPIWGSASSFSTLASTATSPCATTCSCRCNTASRARRWMPRSRGCWSGSTSPARKTAAWPSSRTASGSGSPSAWRSPCVRCSSCSTSRPPAWGPKRPAPPVCSSTRSTRKVLRSSSSSTTWRSCASSARRLPCCTMAACSPRGSLAAIEDNEDVRNIYLGASRTMAVRGRHN